VVCEMIALKNVSKIYGKSLQVVALHNVTMEVEKGEFLAVMGPSGSGKSTLLYIIGGLLTPTKGEVLIDGVSIYKLNPRERAKLRREKIGFIFQTFELIPYLTSLENVMVPLCFSKIPHPEHEEKALKALNLVGLANRASHKPSELSGGEQQRVSIARAIVNDPSILLADEPTGNLDQKTGAEIMHLIKRLNEEEGVTVILVTHDPSKARFADKVAVLIDGQIMKIEKLRNLEEEKFEG